MDLKKFLQGSLGKVKTVEDLGSVFLVKVIKELKTRELVNLALLLADGQTVSGYGMTTTLSFPKEKREEILNEVFGFEEK